MSDNIVYYTRYMNININSEEGNNMFCEKCGAQVDDGAQFCTACGAQMTKPAPEAPAMENVTNSAEVVNETPNTGNANGFNGQNTYQTPPPQAGTPGTAPKSKMVAGLLGIFLGSFGVHNFYLGYTQKAIIQVILGGIGILTSCIVIGVFILTGVGIWGLIEGIMILAGNISVDGNGNPLVD